MGFSAPPADEARINHIQCIGSHNSYKQAIDPVLLTMLKRLDTTRFQAIEYAHISLTDQLTMGLQNLEIDVYADVKGGRYATPKGLELAQGQSVYDPAGVMQKPGFKVFHIQDIDFRSNCPAFMDCLTELKQWSEAHPNHLPVFITMNAKDDTIQRPGFAIPEPFTAPVLDQLDRVIEAGLGRSKLLRPDDVRRSARADSSMTLEATVLGGNWPTISAARGKFIFILDETGPKRAAYIAGHPSLKNRVMFTNSEPGTPEAAFVILNNAIADKDRIQALVRQGYLVRTRADADTRQARSNDYQTFDAAQQSGAQIITTDYYRRSQFFPSTYVVRFANGTYWRRNPLFAE